MINTQICLSVILVTFLSICTTTAFHISTGGSTIAANAVDFITKGKSPANVNITSFYKFFIYPYDVYEYYANDSINLSYTRNFLFLKNNFSYIEPLMNTQNSTVGLQDEDEILYSRIPQVIHIVGQNNQQLEIDLLDANIECKQFVIKNSSLDKIQNGVRVYDLSFYYMHINKYLLKVMNVAYFKTSENSTAASLQEYLLTVLSGFQGKSLEQIKKHKFVVQNILTNESFWQGQDFTSFLVYRVFTRRIKEYTKWRAIYDGFSIYYFSAQIEKTNKSDPLSSEKELQLTRFQVNQGQTKQSRVIKQPLKYVKLLQVQFLEMCRLNQKISVVFGDRKLGYVVDITKDEWHLQLTIKPLTNVSELILQSFGKNCKVYCLERSNVTQKNQTQSKEISVIRQYLSKKQSIKKLNKTINHYFRPSLDYLILCDVKNNCSALQTQKFKEVNDRLVTNLHSNQTDLIIKKEETVSYRIALQQNQINSLFQIFDANQKQQRLIDVNSNSTISATPAPFLHPFYNSLIYRNKTKYISNEMNRQIYEHIKQGTFLQNSKQKDVYFEQIFYEKELEQNCLVPFQFKDTVVEVKFNESKEWVVCVWQHQIRQYTELFLTFREKYINYQLYLCNSFLQLYTDRLSIQCVTLLDQVGGELVETKTMSNVQQLRGGRFYKLYVVKHNEFQPKYLPTIFVKDVQRQQIQVASTIFFLIMIILSLLLLGLVLFITLKSVAINLLVYYGFVQQRVDPTYPLAWFSLKTKLKRMQQHGILKFVQYEPSLSDTEGNHCCFCLQFIKSRTVVAEIYCGHQFHKECFKQWIKNEPNAKCPTCRRLFTRTALAEYQNNMPSQQQLPI